MTSQEYIEGLPHDRLLAALPSLLSHDDTRMQVAVQVVSRLQAQEEDDSQLRSILRILRDKCCGEEYLLELLLELLSSLSLKLPVIQSIPAAAVCATPEQIQVTLNSFREVLQEDRGFLVPIIGSISELRLSDQQKGSLLSLMEGSLALVEDSDIPTVVSALLKVSNGSNIRKVIRSIRSEAARVPGNLAMLLVEPLVSSLRSRTFCSRAYWKEVKESGSLSSMDVLLIGSLLQVGHLRREASKTLLTALASSPQTLNTIVQTIKESSATSISSLQFLYLALQLRYAEASGATGQGLRSFGDRSREGRKANTPKLLPHLLQDYVTSVSKAIFEANPSTPSVRNQLITILLASCGLRAPNSQPRGPQLPLPQIPNPVGQSLLSDAEELGLGLEEPEGARAGELGTGAELYPRVAARALLSLAQSEGSGMGGFEQIRQFLGSQACSSDPQVVSLLARALGIMLRGKRGTSPSPSQPLGQSTDQSLSSSSLLLLQKLFFSPRHGSQAAGLVISGHLLSSESLPPEDMEVVLRCYKRLPFRPSWHSAPQLYQALACCALVLPEKGASELVRSHVMPAALEVGILISETEEEGEGLRSEEPRFQRPGAGGLKGCTLSIHTCVQNVLEGLAVEGLRSRGADPKTILDSRNPGGPSPKTCYSTLRATCQLLETLLLLSSHGNVQEYGIEACAWDVEMPDDLQTSFENVQLASQDLDDAIRIGWSCWLNFATGMRFARMASPSLSDPLTPEVLGRLLQAMQCAHHLTEHVQPVLARHLRDGRKGRGSTKEGILAGQGAGGTGALGVRELRVRELRDLNIFEDPDLPLDVVMRALGAMAPEAESLAALTLMARLLNSRLEMSFEFGSKGPSTPEASQRTSSPSIPGGLTTMVSQALDSGLVRWLGAQAKPLALASHLLRKSLPSQESRGQRSGRQAKKGTEGQEAKEWEMGDQEAERANLGQGEEDVKGWELTRRRELLAEVFFLLISIMGGCHVLDPSGAKGTRSKILTSLVQGAKGIKEGEDSSAPQSPASQLLGSLPSDASGFQGVPEGNEAHGVEEMGVLVAHFSQVLGLIDDAGLGALNLEFLARLTDGTPHAASVGKLARQSLGSVFPTDEVVNHQWIPRPLRSVGAKGSIAVGSSGRGCSPASYFAASSISLLRTKEAFDLSFKLLGALGTEEPETTEMRVEAEFQRVSDPWSSNFKELLGPVLDLGCEPLAGFLAPSSRHSLAGLLAILRMCVGLLLRVLDSVSGPEPMPHQEGVQLEVTKALSKTFSSLKKKLPGFVEETKLLVESHEELSTLITPFVAGVRRVAEKQLEASQKAQGALGALGAAVPKSTLEAKLLLKTVLDTASVHHLELDAMEESELYTVDSTDPLISPATVVSVVWGVGGSGVGGYHDSGIDTESSSEESEDEEEADDGLGEFRMIRKKAKIASSPLEP